MNKIDEFKDKIKHYIDEFYVEKMLFRDGKKFVAKGWLNKDEFLAICLWKSRRPKKLYNLNSASEIKEQTKLAFNSNNELEKISHLTKLHGVQIPTASAILSVTNPDLYPIIDKRTILSLKEMEQIQWKTITIKNWIKYLNLIRKLANELDLTARDVEKGLFAYNRIILDKEFKNLYK